MNGLVLQRELRAQGRSLPTIIITGHGDVPMATRAMKDGALDFIEKPFHHERLLERVHEALSLDRRALAQRLQCAAVLDRWRTLTPRERQVMDLVVASRSNRDMAGELGLHVKTIESHRKHMMSKMRARGAPDLVRMMMMLAEGAGHDGATKRRSDEGAAS